jgi:hypothetical protein
MDLTKLLTPLLPTERRFLKTSTGTVELPAFCEGEIEVQPFSEEDHELERLYRNREPLRLEGYMAFVVGIERVWDDGESRVFYQMGLRTTD